MNHWMMERPCTRFRLGRFRDAAVHGDARCFLELPRPPTTGNDRGASEPGWYSSGGGSAQSTGFSLNHDVYQHIFHAHVAFLDPNSQSQGEKKKTRRAQPQRPNPHCCPFSQQSSHLVPPVTTRTSAPPVNKQQPQGAESPSKALITNRRVSLRPPNPLTLEFGENGCEKNGEDYRKRQRDAVTLRQQMVLVACEESSDRAAIEVEEVGELALLKNEEQNALRLLLPAPEESSTSPKATSPMSSTTRRKMVLVQSMLLQNEDDLRNEIEDLEEDQRSRWKSQRLHSESGTTDVAQAQYPSEEREREDVVREELKERSELIQFLSDELQELLAEEEAAALEAAEREAASGLHEKQRSEQLVRPPSRAAAQAAAEKAAQEAAERAAKEAADRAAREAAERDAIQEEEQQARDDVLTEELGALMRSSLQPKNRSVPRKRLRRLARLPKPLPLRSSLLCLQP